MTLKSYFSGTVEAAMDLARKELGDDALLVNARPATPETRYLGAYEVVFGVTPRAAAVADSVEPNDRTGGKLAEEIAVLKREFDRLKQSMRETAAKPAVLPLPERIQNDQTFEIDATLGIAEQERTIVALIGPPGAGKTTTLAKLAARYGLESRRPAQILSADVFRIGAAGQLRSLAAILGIGCDVAETTGALAQMLEEYRSKELIFIDTPGLSPAEMEDAADLANLIAEYPGMDTHLVVPAYLQPADMNRMIHRYSVFRPNKLLFTHVDETSQHGTFVSQAATWSLPISFLAAGQQIPDDLEPATHARLSELIQPPEQTVPREQAKWAAA
jgi:flagellar biosynthesis protein FlhF